MLTDDSVPLCNVSYREVVLLSIRCLILSVTSCWIFSILQVADFSPVSQNTYYEMPFSVNFVAQSYVTVSFADVDSPRYVHEYNNII